MTEGHDTKMRGHLRALNVAGKESLHLTVSS